MNQYSLILWNPSGILFFFGFVLSIKCLTSYVSPHFLWNQTVDKFYIKRTWEIVVEKYALSWNGIN